MIGALLRWLYNEPRPPQVWHPGPPQQERLDADELALRRAYAALLRRRDRFERRRVR